MFFLEIDIVLIFLKNCPRKLIADKRNEID